MSVEIYPYFHQIFEFLTSVSLLLCSPPALTAETFLDTKMIGDFLLSHYTVLNSTSRFKIKVFWGGKTMS